MSDASRDSSYPDHSPDGLYHIEWSMVEARMSHWICSPKIVHAATGQVIFDLIGSDWDASFRWLDAGRFYVYLRQYSGGKGIEVWVDPPNGMFRIGAEDAKAEPLSEFRRVVTGDSENDVAAVETPNDTPPSFDWSTIEVDLPDGRREKVAVLKGFEERVRQSYAKFAASVGQESKASSQIKTCPHLQLIERAIEEAIAASVGRFEAQGFSLERLSSNTWGSPGPDWRCYSCGGGKALSYLDAASLRARLTLPTRVTYEEVIDEGRQSPALVMFCCQDCRCAILGVPTTAIDDGLSGTQSTRVAPEGWRPWRLIIS